MTIRLRQPSDLWRLVMLFSFCLSSVATASAQTGTKAIIQRLTLVKYPVEVSFELKGEPLKFKETVDTNEGVRYFEFDADKDWLNQLAVKIKNVSGKSITYILLNLHFPEIIKNGRTGLDQVYLGVDPDRKFSRPEIKLGPNETLEVQLSKEEKVIQRLVDLIGGVSAEGITKVWIEFHAALIDDDLLFEAGTYYRRNPDTNTQPKWIPVEKP